MTKNERKKAADRANAVAEACRDEIQRFNDAVKRLAAAGTPLRVNSPGSLSHGRIVRFMGFDFWLHTGSGSFTDQQSWCYANDERWAKLLENAGVERHPLFKGD